VKFGTFPFLFPAVFSSHVTYVVSAPSTLIDGTSGMGSMSPPQRGGAPASPSDVCILLNVFTFCYIILLLNNNVTLSNFVLVSSFLHLSTLCFPLLLISFALPLSPFAPPYVYQVDPFLHSSVPHSYHFKFNSSHPSLLFAPFFLISLLFLTESAVVQIYNDIIIITGPPNGPVLFSSLASFVC